MRAIIETQAQINEADPSLDSVMRIVVDKAMELTPASGACVELAEGDEMVYAVVGGSLVGQDGLRLNLHTSLSGLSVRTGETTVCTDSEEDPRVDAAACRKVGLRSMIVVPLIHRGATVGVLKVVHPMPGAFSDVDVSTMEPLARFIASSMFHASELEAALRDASTDGLTGIANRTAFLQAARGALSRARRSGATIGVLFVDLDRFKPINDEHGHETGDAVLTTIARRMKAITREGDVVGRLGGDEFAVLTETQKRQGLDRLANRLAAAISEPILIADASVTVGASIGVATASGVDQAESLIARADAAMYAAKRDRSR